MSSLIAYRFIWHSQIHGSMPLVTLPLQNNQEFFTKQMNREILQRQQSLYSKQAIQPLAPLARGSSGNMTAQQHEHITGNGIEPASKPTMSFTKPSPNVVPLPFKKNDVMSEQVRFFMSHQAPTSTQRVSHSVGSDSVDDSPERRTLKKTSESTLAGSHPSITPESLGSTSLHTEAQINTDDALSSLKSIRPFE